MAAGDTLASSVGDGVAVGVGVADALDELGIGASVSVGVAEGAVATSPSPRMPFRPKAIPPPTMIAPTITAAATALRLGEWVTYAHGDVRRGSGFWAAIHPPDQLGWLP